MAPNPEAWRVREVTKFHRDDEHTTLEALEIWSGDNLVCGDVDTEEHARHIALTPTMLAILQDSVEIIAVARESREEMIGEKDDVLRDLERRIRKAVAKAEGK